MREGTSHKIEKNNEKEIQKLTVGLPVGAFRGLMVGVGTIGLDDGALVGPSEGAAIVGLPVGAGSV